jgi:putative spermidine/putrescine transport system substrate-binding protein
MQRRVGRWATVTLATTVLCFMAAGCGGDDDDGDAGGGTTTEAGGAPAGMLQTLGEGEGQVNLIAWAG